MTTSNSDHARSLVSRLRGAVLGALVGDALGVPVEFSSREERDADPVTGPRAFGQWQQPAGTWSDDGALLLCTLDALTQGGGLAETAANFVRWRREALWTARGEVFDIGMTTNKAITRLAAGAAPASAGPATAYDNGNGSLMRILPVALQLHAAPAEQLVAQARAFSRLTHGHARAQFACAAYCVAVAALLRGESVAAACTAAQATLAALCADQPGEQPSFARLLAPDFARLPRRDIASGGYVIETLEAALWCLQQYDSYEATVLAAVNLGGDTDTTACVAGGLAGAAYGLEAIPAAWLAVLPQAARLEALLEASLRQFTSPPLLAENARPAGSSPAVP